MARSMRADTSKPGLAALTDDDLALLDAGQVTASEIAVKIGTSKAAVTKWARKRRQGSQKASPPSAAASPAPGTSASPAASPAPPEGIDPNDARQALVAAARLAVYQAHRMLGDPSRPLQIGPQAGKAVVAMLSGAAAVLRDLGEITEAPNNGMAELSISVMSAAEAEALQAELAEAHGATFDNDS